MKKVTLLQLQPGLSFNFGRCVCGHAFDGLFVVRRRHCGIKFLFFPKYQRHRTDIDSIDASYLPVDVKTDAEQLL